MEKTDKEIDKRFENFKRAIYMKHSMEVKKMFETKVMNEIDYTHNNYSDHLEQIQNEILEMVILSH